MERRWYDRERKSFEVDKCLNIYWKIKNFSYCCETIVSPEFTYADKSWYLKLDTSKGIKCKIICFNFDDYSYKVKISFLTCDDSEEIQKELYSRGDLYYLEVSKTDIFGERRSAFLPKDTLTILCQFESEAQYYRGTISIRSQIGVKRKCFLWNLKNFSTKNENKSVLVENSDQYGDIQLNLKSVGGINSDEQFYIEISRRGGEKCYCVLKVSMLDKGGKAANHVSDEYFFEKETQKKQLWRFPPIIRRSRFLASKNVLLHNDILSLKCEFAITLGEVSDETVVYSYNRDILQLLQNYELPMCFKEENQSMDLKTDMKNILEQGSFSDVCFQVGSNEIKAHKNILSARSTVFNAMFTKNMKESISNRVVIEDIDFETMRKLLQYMYTDTISDIQWENIVSLYFAADKYEVLSLKQECSSFLKDNICFKNVCEVLVLADLHQDLELKSVVHGFLVKYDSEVFASDAWRDLEKNNSSLAFQTMREICANKRLD